MTTTRRVSIVFVLVLSACAGVASPDDEDLAATSQAIAGGGCVMTPFTYEDRYYCISLLDGVTDQYWRWDNNGSFPVFGTVPSSGSVTRYNRNQPYRTVTNYSGLSAYNAIIGCLQDTSGVTQYNINLGGQACTVDVMKRQYPLPRSFAVGCGGSYQMWCVEHDGPRAFGGAHD